MDRKQLIRKLYNWQNAQYRLSGIDINDYPFICFDFCSDDQLSMYAMQLPDTEFH